MDIGPPRREGSGLTGKVFLATSGGGEQKGACDLVKSGAFDLDLSYDVPTQGDRHGRDHQVAAVVGHEARHVKGSIYTTLIPVTKDNAGIDGTCWKLEQLKKQ
jgi:hypothetical protein